MPVLGPLARTSLGENIFFPSYDMDLWVQNSIAVFDFGGAAEILLGYIGGAARQLLAIIAVAAFVVTITFIGAVHHIYSAYLKPRGRGK